MEICETPFLSVVIPAWSGRFLREALDSFASQAVPGVEVFVGDDCSPDALGAIVEEFQDRIGVRYERFEQNLGKDNLVEQWNRCVRRTSAPWVWLFSDDDIARPDCLSSLQVSLESTTANVVRFQTEVIDSHGRLIRWTPSHPKFERAWQFAYHRHRGHRESFVSENIFKRSVFDGEGGFVGFPAAWCSDDASWIAFSGSGLIETLDTGSVAWRASGGNISTSRNWKSQKLAALVQYDHWLEDRGVFSAWTDSGLDEKWVEGLRRGWFYRQVQSLPGGAELRDLKRISAEIPWKGGRGGFPVFASMLKDKAMGLIR